MKNDDIQRKVGMKLRRTPDKAEYQDSYLMKYSTFVASLLKHIETPPRVSKPVHPGEESQHTNLHNILENPLCHPTSSRALAQNDLLTKLPYLRGWSGGAMVLGKLPVPGRPTIWITVGQGPTALAVGAGGGCLDIFTLIYPFFPPFSLSLGDSPI